MKIISKMDRVKEKKSNEGSLKTLDNNENTANNQGIQRLNSNDSNKIIDTLCDHTNSITSVFEWYSTNSKTSPNDANNGNSSSSKILSESKHSAGGKQYYFTSRNFFQKRNDSGNGNNITNESNKKNSFKMGLFKIAEDEWANEYDDSEEENKDGVKLQLKKPHLDKKSSHPDDYSSSRERINGNIRMINTKTDPLVKPKNNYNIPRGKDMLFSYNTQYGSGFGNFKNTKFAQYNHAYSRIQDTKKGPKKKQTASSLQRIEQSHLFGNISGYNKITSNISKNEIGSSIYDIDSSDICLGKKKSSAMEVMEFAKMFK